MCEESTKSLFKPKCYNYFYCLTYFFFNLKSILKHQKKFKEILNMLNLIEPKKTHTTKRLLTCKINYFNQNNSQTPICQKYSKPN